MLPVKIRVESFNKSNLSFIQEWLKKRELPLIPTEDLPKIGFMATLENRPVAAAFLRRCEGNLALFDSLVTDPEAESTVRHAAIETLVKCVFDMARELKITRLIAFSTDSGTLERGQRHGFVKQPYTVISLNLAS